MEADVRTLLCARNRFMRSCSVALGLFELKVCGVVLRAETDAEQRLKVSQC